MGQGRIYSICKALSGNGEKKIVQACHVQFLAWGRDMTWKKLLLEVRRFCRFGQNRLLINIHDSVFLRVLI